MANKTIPPGVLEKKNKDRTKNQEAWRLMKSVYKRKQSGGLQINELIDPLHDSN